MISRLVCSFILVALTASGQAATWRVPQDAPTIAAAIDSTSHGDVVEVSCGTYYEYGLLLKSGITIRSVKGEPGCVVIDAQGRGRVMYGEDLDETTELQGLTFTGGDVSQADVLAGGGVWIKASNVTFTDCTFLENSAPLSGGGLFISGWSSPVLIGCTFRLNKAGQGGAITFIGYSISLSHCTIEENSATESKAGGVLLGMFSSHELDGCLFRGNRAVSDGGALFFESSFGSEIRNCRFEDNSADRGGGIFVNIYEAPEIENSSLRSNHATSAGGGIYIRPMFTSMTVVNTDIKGNTATDGPDGFYEVENGHVLTLRCCDTAQEGWAGSEAILFDDDGCSVPAESMTWGKLKRHFR